MADQRRRGGRGRTGRGGRIPRRGEGGGAAAPRGETFPSFPPECPVPIEVTAALAAGAREAAAARVREAEAATLALLTSASAESEDSELDEAARLRLRRLADSVARRLAELGCTEPAAPAPDSGDVAQVLGQAAAGLFGTVLLWELLHAVARTAGDTSLLAAAAVGARECERQSRAVQREVLKVALFRAHAEA